MAITQEVNIEMLEKLPDGNYKKKNPQTKASQVMANNGQTVEQHLADDNVIKHRAKQIGFNEAGMTATTVNEAILEAFMLGNNTKKDLVDKLLLLDPSLSISYSSTWQVILAAISGISTGKKWAIGTVQTGGTNTRFQNQFGSRLDAISAQVTGLPFKPKTVLIYASYGDLACSITTDSVPLRTGGFNTGSAGILGLFRLEAPAEISNDGFILPVSAANNTLTWIAFE